VLGEDRRGLADGVLLAAHARGEEHLPVDVLEEVSEGRADGDVVLE
jgi:hypothetical protein